MSNYPDDMKWRAFDALQGGNARHWSEVGNVRALLPRFWALHEELRGTDSPDAEFTKTVRDAADTIEGALAQIAKVVP